MITEERIQELRELLRMQEEITAEITAIQDEIKAEMTATGNYTITGTTFKASWNEVTTSRIDTKRLKADLPDVANKYMKTTTSRRFIFK